MSIDAFSIESGLTDKNVHIRLSWSNRTDFTPTPEQVERGLTDENVEVRAAWAYRIDFIPNK